MRTERAPVILDYDVDTAAQMLAALRTCPQGKQLDTLAVIVKIFVQDDLNAVAFPEATDE
jgi:hypothetical protein